MTSHTYSMDYPVGWEEFHRNARALSLRLLQLGPWKGIVAITRGGLVPAGIIARELDIRFIDTLCISSYQQENVATTLSTDDAKVQGELQLLKSVSGDGDGMLLIDDLVDTGKTARFARELLPKAHFATLYAKPSGKPLVDTFITEVSQDTWIRFPWDMEYAFSAPLAERK